MAIPDFLTSSQTGGLSLAEELGIPAATAGEYSIQRQGRIGGPLGEMLNPQIIECGFTPAPPEALGRLIAERSA